MKIEIVDQDKAEGLTRQVWEFDVHIPGYHAEVGIHAQLRLYETQTRTTKRHKWTKAGEGYKRRGHNGTIHYGGWRLDAADVPVPPWVVDQVRDQITARISIIGAVNPPDMKP